MSSETTSNLIPMADVYLRERKNILLIGLHGTGKTQSIMEIAKKNGVKMKYYSCSTLDPYTDLVGVPVPKTDDNGKDFLKMVRPRDIDEAEIIFFDEFNRADPKTINAVFEIIQFQSINGEHLPNLQCCWAAINPPDKDYNVEQLDPAMIDRFDAFIEIKPSPSVAYLATKMPKEIAQALVSWWNEQNRARRKFEDYISPRRLEKIGMIYDVTRNQEAVKQAMPPGGNFDVKKLIEKLEIAIGKRKKDEVIHNIGTSASDKFQYTQGGIYQKREEIVKYLQQNPFEHETQKKICDTLKNANVGNDTLIVAYGEILNALTPAIFESFFNGLTTTKKSQIRNAFQKIKKTDITKTDALPNVEKVLGKSAKTGDWKK